MTKYLIIRDIQFYTVVEAENEDTAKEIAITDLNKRLGEYPFRWMSTSYEAQQYPDGAFFEKHLLTDSPLPFDEFADIPDEQEADYEF